jgi:hypothetical protein
VRRFVLVLVVPTSLRTTRIAHSTKSYVGQAVLVLDSARTEHRSGAQNRDGTQFFRPNGLMANAAPRLGGPAGFDLISAPHPWIDFDFTVWPCGEPRPTSPEALPCQPWACAILSQLLEVLTDYSGSRCLDSAFSDEHF